MTKFYETMFGLSLDYDTPLNYSNFPNQIWLTVGWNFLPLGEIQEMDFKLNRVESHLGQE